MVYCKKSLIWLMLFCGVLAISSISQAQNILVLNEQCEGSAAYFPTAIGNLGYAFTETNADWSFYGELTGGTLWDLVIVDEYSNGLSYETVGAIQSYIANGGKCYMNYWMWDPDTAGAFEARLGEHYYYPIPIYRWDTAHPLFTSPNTLPDVDPTQDTCGSDGAYFEPAGEGLAIGGYTRSPSSGQAAYIIGNDGRTILFGGIPGEFTGDADADGKFDMLEFAENVVAFLMKGNETCPGFDISLNDLCSGTGNTLIRTGSTASAADDIEESEIIVCDPGSDPVPEQVFNFTPASDIDLQIDLSGSSYDTVMAIVSPCPDGMDICMFNDDYDGLSSGFDCATFNAGITYYIIVYGFGGATGDYVLNITECGAPVSCQSCPCFDYSLQMEMVYQTHSDAIDVGACKVYQVGLSAGDSAEFTFCDGGGTADFDTYLTLRNGACEIVASNDDTCGLLSEIEYEVPMSGVYYLEVNSCCVGGSGGSYTLAYQIESLCPTCPQSNFSVEPVEEYQLHSSSIVPGGCKVYEMTLEADNFVTFSFCDAGATANYDTYLTLRDSSCNILAANDDYCGLLSKINYRIDYTDTYYMEVNSCCTGGSGGDYTVAYRQVSAIHCYDCPEFDYGTFYPWYGYYELHRDSITQGECRWYQFYLNELTDYIFTVCKGGGEYYGNSVFELYDSGCNLMKSNDDWCDLGSEIQFNAPVSDYYYLKVYGFEGSPLDYTLAFQAVLPPHCYECPQYDYGTFYPWYDVFDYHSDSFGEGECRWYQFYMDEMTDYVFTVCQGEGSYVGDSVFELYDSGCTLLKSNDNTCDMGSEILFTAPASDMYYLKVMGTHESALEYTLAFKATMPPHCYECPQYDYEFYPGMGFQTHASSFGEGECRWYLFYLNEMTDYVFSVCQGGGSYTGDSVFELYDSGCNLLKSNDNACDLGSEILFTPPAGDYYFLKVYGADESALDYTLAFAAASQCSDCPNPDFTIYPTMEFQTVSGTIPVYGCKMYEITMEARCTYFLTFCEGGGTGDYDTYLRLYNSDCGIEAENDDYCGLLSNITYTAPSSGTYYLMVTSCCIGGSGGNYTLAYRTDCLPAPTPTPTPSTCLHTGDVVPNGSITAGDAQRAFAITLGAYEPTEVEFCAADCNGNGTVTAGDAQSIFGMALGIGECVDPL